MPTKSSLDRHDGTTSPSDVEGALLIGDISTRLPGLVAQVLVSDTQVFEQVVMHIVGELKKSDYNERLSDCSETARNVTGEQCFPMALSQPALLLVAGLDPRLGRSGDDISLLQPSPQNHLGGAAAWSSRSVL
jgi:hypothetical protein